MSALTLALPSKGRLREDLDRFLAERGTRVRSAGGARGYVAALDGFPNIDVRLLSASEIAKALRVGEIHLGVTGQDLLGESAAANGPGGGAELSALGFGRADLVVAAPASWLDVAGMADLQAIAPALRARTGRRLRVATKYAGLTRQFFEGAGVFDYRITPSAGATEGAPEAGQADVIVDITSTGRTLAANGLKVLEGGVILRSEACLAAAPGAVWNADTIAAARRLFARLSARSRAEAVVDLRSSPAAPRAMEAAAAAVGGDMVGEGALRAPAAMMDEAAEALLAAGAESVAVARADYVFERDEPIAERLDAVLNRAESD